MSAWTDLGDGVSVRRSRAYEMNSTLLVLDGHAVAIDPGVLPSELDDFAARVAIAAPRLDRVALVLTHPHWDHVLARPWFPGATAVAHVGFADELERDAAHIESRAREWIEGAGEAWTRPFTAFTPELLVRGTADLPLGPLRAVAYEAPGHCASQIALYFPGPRVFVAADMLSDIEIPWLDAAPWVYRRTLVALQSVFEHEDVRVLVPGHGPLAMGRAEAYRRLLRDLGYLIQLEERVGAAHAAGRSLEQAQADCASMEYTGRDAAYSMREVHAKNVRLAWEALADARGARDS